MFGGYSPPVNLASPGPIGGTTPGAGHFTTLDVVTSLDPTAANTVDLGGINHFRNITIDGYLVAGNGLRMPGGWFTAATGGIALGPGPDFVFNTEGANVLALRNGASAQVQRWYATFTDASNYSRVELSVTGSAVAYAIQEAGTGVGTLAKHQFKTGSSFALVQGKLQTDSNAVTGLIAGALSALTTASITITDASGQVYRVPCVI